MSWKSLTSAFLLTLTVCVLSGCGSEDDSAAGKGKKTNGRSKSPRSFADLLPEETFVYIRINDVQRAKNQFIRPQHVTDAAVAQKAINDLIDKQLRAIKSDGNEFGVSGLTLLQFVNDLKTVHFALWKLTPDGVPDPEGVVAILEISGTTGLREIRKELGDKLKSEKISGQQVNLIDLLGEKEPFAFFMHDDRTIIAGRREVLRKIIERQQKLAGNSLQSSSRFQQALKDFGADGELFTYVNVQEFCKFQKLPTESISHVAASLGVDGGFALRAYAVKGKPFPDFLVRTPRKKKFLNCIPAEAAFLISSSFDSGREMRTKFADWVTKSFTKDYSFATNLLPDEKRRAALLFAQNQELLGSKVIAILRDMWFGVLPVKSESAMYVAPNRKGQWGLGAIFDIENKEPMKPLKQKLLALGKKTGLTWKQDDYEGLTIHYLDFAEIAVIKGKHPIPAELKKLLQTKIGYAQSDDMFLLGSVGLIKFAYRPKGKTLESEFSYKYIDAENAMMISIRPGRILQRDFGQEKIDRVLRKVRKEIPIDSSYTITVNLRRDEATVRSNIPFTSLIGWLVTEFALGKGPADLKKEIEGTDAEDRKRKAGSEE